MWLRNTLAKAKSKFTRVIKEPIYIPTLQGSLLEKKTVFITGGVSGIGLSIAEVCLENGAFVIITSRTEIKLVKAREQLIRKIPNSENRIFTIILDLSRTELIENVLRSAVELVPTKQIDILVNNAGMQAGNNIGDTSIDSYNQVLDTNLKGTYFLSQVFSNYLIGSNIRGNILNVLSSSSNRPAISPYMVSKWGEVGLTKGLAKRLIKFDIVVNGIAPGPTATSFLNKDGSDLYNSNSLSKRYTDPKEVANLAVFMISNMGRMIIGEVVYITGGSGTLTYDDIGY